MTMREHNRATVSVLFLGHRDSLICRHLQTQGVLDHDTLFPIEESDLRGITHIVSHGYRHRILPSVLDLFPYRAVNVHISYLPWNRGSDPNLWAWLEDTPKGATVYMLDEDLDTGPIIAQQQIFMDPDAETLRTSYAKLQALAVALFVEAWPSIADGTVHATPQMGPTTYHRTADKMQFDDLLQARGWDTPCSVLADYAAAVQVSAAARDAEIEELQI